MNRSVVIALAIVTIFLMVLFAIYGGSGSGKINWKENYKSGNKQPYGTYIVHKMLQNYFPDKSFKDVTNISEQLPLDSDSISNYIFVGEGMLVDSADLNHLLRYVSQGNKAFLSSKTAAYDLLHYLYFYECNYTPWNDYSFIMEPTALFNLLHEDLEYKNERLSFSYKENFNSIDYQWNYIDSVYFCELDYGAEGFIELGYFERDIIGSDRYTNFAMIRYKSLEHPEDPGGIFYLHTTPLMFSNLSLSDSTGLGKEYISRTFSHLAEGDIYWDNYSQVKANVRRDVNQVQRNPDELTFSAESPLKYVLADKHLSWAWFSLVGIGILYLMFRAKRRQRIIPVVEPNTNTSLEYISTMGALYYNKKNHKKLSEQKMKMFLAFVRNRYGLSTKRLDKEFVNKLAKRSGISSMILLEVLDSFQQIKKSSFVNDQTLVGFHKMMDDIYKQCK